MESVKVALVNKLYHPVIGGVETHVRDLANHLPDWVERKVLAVSEDKKPRVEIIDGVEVIKAKSLGIYFSSPLPVGFTSELKKLAKWADIFHFHFPFPPGEVSFLLGNIKKPLIVTYHSDIVRQKFLSYLYKPLLFAFLGKAKKIIATSPKYIETSPVLSKFKEKCVVIPLGIETNKYEPDAEVLAKAQKIMEEVGGPFILFVGRLTYYKGVEYLIKAMNKIPEPYRLVIVGSGPLEASLKKLVDELGLTGRVFFYKPQPFKYLLAFYHACELFVLPSVERSEAFGIVQLEAQACGKPVVSTELGTGTSFANLDGFTGFVVPPKDEKSLAEAMLKILTDEKLKLDFGKNARKRVKEEFDVKVMAEKVAQLYKSLL